MAREMYLVGVSKEELEYHPPTPSPQTPKSWLANFWYHYKWATLFVLFVLSAATVVVVQLATRVEPDYRLFLAVDGYEVPPTAVKQLQTELESCGTDVNGDGKTVVQIQSVNVSLKGANYSLGSANRQAFTAHLIARDVWFFAFSPEYYDTVIQNLSGGKELFAPLSVQADGVSDDGTYWSWKNLSWLGDYDKDLLPDDLYFMVRQPGDNASDTEKAMAQQALSLLQAYVKK